MSFPSSTSSNADRRSNSDKSGGASDLTVQPQRAYEGPTTLILGFFQWLLLTILRVLAIAIKIRVEDRQITIDGGEQQASGVTANEIHRAPETLPHNSSSSTSMQTDNREPSLNIAGPVAAPAFQGAHGVNIGGSARFTNIGMNTGNLTTVNNYGGTHGLENLKEFVSFAALYDSSEQDPDCRCHPGTRKNVLARLQYWIDNPNPTDRIFWLYGPAGAGKSAIAQTIAHAYKQGQIASTFFFYRSDPGRNDGNRLFTTIAWQLAFSIPAFKDFIVHALDKTPHLPRKNIETQFEELVAHPFKPTNDIVSRMPYPAPVVIIDGVDECSNEHLQRRILDVIGNAVKDCHVPLRFLICSRPEAWIEETLNQFKDFTLHIDLAALNDANHDIGKYLVDQFSVIASKQHLSPTWPGPEIIQEIVFKSSGNFILAATLIRFIGDEDHSAKSQLDIVRNLKPRGKISPFTLLDELYLEILKRQPDQDFLKTFLALLVGRSSINDASDLHKDDAMLMNVSEEFELHIKLRRMRSLLKFEPFIDVYHQSFLDFLQDSSRSGQYHVSKQGRQKRYLELVVESVIRHVTMAIEHPNRHQTCFLSPEYKFIVDLYPPKIKLPVRDWQDTLKPLLDLQDKLLNRPKPQMCPVIQIMRDFLLHLAILQNFSDCAAASQALDLNMNGTVTGFGVTLMTEARQNIPENDSDGCLSTLLSCVPETGSFAVDVTITNVVSSLLDFEYTEIAARIRSISDAQKLIDLIDLLINNQPLFSYCGSDSARKAAYLASEIFARVPVLPHSLLLNRDPCYCYGSGPFTLELMCQSRFVSRILDHNYIVPVVWIIDGEDRLSFVSGNVNGQNESVDRWLERTQPNLVERLRVMLQAARVIRYIHSMNITLYSYYIQSTYFFLDSNFRTKFRFIGLFAWWLREASKYGHHAAELLNDCTFESNISAFGGLFKEVCSDGDNTKNSPNREVEVANQLIERCRAKDPKRQLTMEDVVKEMETWDLS